jgi:hypothetical protein
MLFFNTLGWIGIIFMSIGFCFLAFVQHRRSLSHDKFFTWNVELNASDKKKIKIGLVILFIGIILFLLAVLVK